jgi:hypothetical protein
MPFQHLKKLSNTLNAFQRIQLMSLLYKIMVTYKKSFFLNQIDFLMFQKSNNSYLKLTSQKAEL